MDNKINEYIEAIKADFLLWNGFPYDSYIKVIKGRKYIKLDTIDGVHSFIVATDTDKKFKKGDILQPASWEAPKRNRAYGNIFGKYEAQWAGA